MSAGACFPRYGTMRRHSESSDIRTAPAAAERRSLSTHHSHNGVDGSSSTLKLPSPNRRAKCVGDIAALPRSCRRTDHAHTSEIRIGATAFSNRPQGNTLILESSVKRGPQMEKITEILIHPLPEELIVELTGEDVEDDVVTSYPFEYGEDQTEVRPKEVIDSKHESAVREALFDAGYSLLE